MLAVMLNAQPIFINGLSRGGTTILLNLVASHPDVALAGETHKVFKGCRQNDSVLRVAAKAVLREAPVLAATRQDYFSPRRVASRPVLSHRLREHVDRCLYREKLRRHPALNRFRVPDQRYTRQELTRSRLLAKNLDGAIQLSDTFDVMYPDATFIGLIRNGLAVCEGHVRRGRDPALIGSIYRRLGEALLGHVERFERCVLLRFEDLLRNPVGLLQRACVAAELNPFKLRQVRWQLRKKLDARGHHLLLRGREWNVEWHALNDLPAQVDPDVDQHQVANLRPQDRDLFLREAGSTMERLGYATGPRSQLRDAA